MMLLGFFLLIAKYSNLKIGQEGESGNIQNGAELPGKEKEKEKERRREKGVDKTGKYNFKDSGIGNSWLIGDDTYDGANAYVRYYQGCEENLTIPHELTDSSGQTKKVEVIGQWAFNNCGNKNYDGKTRSIVLSRYIKVIKYRGLGNMGDVTSFRIEEGSCLESIEMYGLSWMSWENYNEDARRSILVLPSTVTSIAENGLYDNNLIKTIYYCGSTHLSNSSDLKYGEVSEPDIKVTSLYKYGTIFGSYTPKKDSSSIAEAEEVCNKYKPKASPSPSPSPSHSPAASSQPTADYQVRGRTISLLRRLSRAGRSGRMGVGSLRRGELQTAESDPVKPE